MGFNPVFVIFSICLWHIMLIFSSLKENSQMDNVSLGIFLKIISPM